MTTDEEAIYESVFFLDYFSDLPDPRQLIKAIYPLDEVLLLSLLAVLAGAETFTDIARFGENKLDLLRRFRLFLNKTPTHDRLGEIFAALDAERFQQCFVAWVAAHTGIAAEVIAIDNKTSRRSHQKKGADAPIHIVSAFAARQRLVLGQVKVAEKSNEITAIPKLLDMLVVEGAIDHHRCHGMPARYRPQGDRQEGRRCLRPERQSGHAARRRRAFRKRIKSQ